MAPYTQSTTTMVSAISTMDYAAVDSDFAVAAATGESAPPGHAYDNVPIEADVIMKTEPNAAELEVCSATPDELMPRPSAPEIQTWDM